MLTVVRRAALVAGAVLLVAGCQSVPADYKPDPALKTESPAKLQARVTEACVKSQRARSSLQTPELRKTCGCYAAATFKAMDKSEVEFYRANGYFSDVTRPKGEAARKSCGIR
jgi:hypothetical protein